MEIFYIANDNSFIKTKLRFAGLDNPIKINSIKEIKSNDKWVLFIDMTDNNISFHNEFILYIKKLIYTNEQIYFFDKKNVIKDSKCFLIKSELINEDIYNLTYNNNYSHLTHYGLDYGSFNDYQLINYKFEEELKELYYTFIKNYESYFSKKSGYRYKYVFDFEKHIFKYFKPFVIILNLNHKNKDKIQKLVYKLSCMSYPYFRIILLCNVNNIDYNEFKFRRTLLVHKNNLSRPQFIHMCASCEYIVFILNDTLPNLFNINNIHNSVIKYYSKDVFSVNVLYYIENVPLMLGYTKDLEVSNNNDDINYLVNLDDNIYLDTEKPKENRHIYKITEPFFFKLRRYLYRKDIQEGLKLIYEDLEKTTNKNRFNVLIMTLVSFLAIAEDTKSLEKELFRASIVFKNDHNTYKQYLLIIDNCEHSLTPKFRKLFYNKALEFKEYNEKFRYYILAKVLGLPDIDKDEMKIYIDTYKNINKKLNDNENKTLIELFLKRLSLQFIEENYIQDFTNILFENFNTTHKLETKEDYNNMMNKFKDLFPELIVRLSIYFDHYEDDYYKIIERRVNISKSLD